MKKSFISFLLILSLLFSMAIPVFADDPIPAGYITISIDANTLGAGFLQEPAKIPFYDGENYAAVTDRFLKDIYTNSGSIDSGFYLQKIKISDISVNVPEVILSELGMSNNEVISGGRNNENFLGEFDYTYSSGWMYTVNNQFPLGASTEYPSDGDVCRWQFTLCGYGADLGVDSGWGAPVLYSGADRGNLLKEIAQINSSANKAEILSKPEVRTAYDNAIAILENLIAEQAQVDLAETSLKTALTLTPPPSSMDINTQLNGSLAYISSTVSQPEFGTGGGEWSILALARAEYPVTEGYYEGYYNRIVNHVESVNGVLDTKKYTEYSRLILALSSIGKDATDVGGYDMTKPLADYTQTIFQGINGPIFALLALDSNNYDIPAYDNKGNPATATRQTYINYILDKEVKKGTVDAGGFSLSGAADPDITAMALQALAPYRSQPEVAAAINRALTVLSGLQKADGGFASWGTINCESCAQVIVALCSLGIDPATDSRFVKNGNNVVSAMLGFYVAGGGFKHVTTSGINGMATDQGTYALVAYDRFINGKSSLYNMTDAFTSENNPQNVNALISIEAPDSIMGKANQSFNAIIKTDAFPSGDYKLMDGVINIPDEFSVESVTAGSAITGGTIAWNYNSTDKKLRFVYTNADLNSIGISVNEFPAELLVINMKLKTDIDVSVNPDTDITVGGMTLKEASDKPAFIFDISKAVKTIAFTDIAFTVRELFRGDDIDLIPSNKRAIAITVSNIEDGKKVSYKGADLIHSAEMTQKHGVNTYVLIVNPTEEDSNFINSSNYTVNSESAPTVKFGDTDGNGIINAQDALDVISGWIRKTSVDTDMKILRMNVTSDSRINTFDALAIMENYVNASEFVIVSK